jgi:hypothetical protein
MFSEFLTTTLRACGLNPRPAYYSGRGATLTDLNSQKLEAIHGAIAHHVSPEAAEAFVEMVEDIPTLSATEFLLALAELEMNDFTRSASARTSKNGIYFENEDDALCTTCVVLAGRDRLRDDQTQSITGPFLRMHSKRPQKSVFDYLGRTSMNEGADA